eukprot:CAMPEP_0117429766 /NCGR_PEP_ID=MMETSP0758-20121206/9283_1 /TAXON_ID=63605 /ORGANISM="Percolomonas cosmopolitus, Strain AE-1 (ATCC 50343)" /LENGTH=135 /DNA_ID=CAMNT_0005217069 /DNA_START=11 /DNA_END=418 /DNA_ORIENTATION=+
MGKKLVGLDVKPSDSLFAEIIKGNIPSNKVYEDDRSYVFRDINPVASTHLLIISKKFEIGNVREATPEMEADLGYLLRVAAKVAKSEGIEDYRLVINSGAKALQTVNYLHIHLISNGESNLTWPPGVGTKEKSEK